MDTSVQLKSVDSPPTKPSTHPGEIKTQNTVRLIVSGAVVATLIVGVLIAVFTLNDYRNRITQAQSTLDRTLLIYQENTRLIFNGMDSLLYATREYMLSDDVIDVGGLHIFLRQTTAGIPFLRSLIVLDANGVVIAESRPEQVAVGMNVSDRGHFIFHQQTTEDILYIDQPVQSRVDGRWSMPISRSVRDRNGELLGVVVSSIEPRYFIDQFATVSDYQVEIGALLRIDDGLILSVFPEDDTLIGQILPNEAVLEPYKGVPGSHIFSDELFGHNGDHLSAYTEVGPLPIAIVFEMRIDEFMGDFYVQAALSGAGFFFFLCMTSGIAIYQIRQTRALGTQGNALVKANHYLQTEIEARIHKEVALYETTSRLNLLLENLPVALYTCNLNQGMITNYVSASVENLTGFTPDKFINTNFWMARLHPADRQPVLDVLGDLSEDEYSYEYRWRTASGQYRWYADNLKIVHDATGPKGVGIWYDIHDRQQVDSARQTADNLRLELEREQELRALRSTFVSMITHELRNPLATIQFTVSSLQRYMARMEPAKVEEKFNMVHGQVRQMNDLVEDILMIGKLEQGMMTVQSTREDLLVFCEEVVVNFRELYSSTHNIHFITDKRPIMLAFDHKLMRQALNNLLGNAVKYSVEGTTVTLELHRQSDQAIIKVTDQGIGIPEKALSRLFETFYRADNVGDRPGTGLGLAITRLVIEISGGVIEVDSKLNIGTTFTIKLPIA